MKVLQRIQGPISLLLLLAMLIGGIGVLAVHVTNRSNASLVPDAHLQGALNAHSTLVAATAPQQAPTVKPKGALVSISTTNLIVSKCTDPTTIAAVPVTEKDL